MCRPGTKQALNPVVAWCDQVLAGLSDWSCDAWRKEFMLRHGREPSDLEVELVKRFAPEVERLREEAMSKRRGE